MKKLIVFLLSSLLCVGAIALTTVVTNVVYVTNTVVVPQQQIVYPGQPTPQTVVVQPAPTVIYQPAPVVVEPIIVRPYPYYYHPRPFIGIGIGFGYHHFHRY